MATLVPHLPLCVLSCLILFIFISSASAASEEKVKLSLYYETLSPPCARFMVNNLSEIFKNGLINITDLHLVPYGNAELDPSDNKTIICQHGQDECDLNLIEACAIALWPTVSVHYPVLHCIESLVMEKNYYEWRSCFQKMGLNDKLVDDCHATGKGNELELQYGKETDNLKPPHEYVPWVVVNDKPLGLNYTNFMGSICNAYKGKDVPEACKESSPPQPRAEEIDIKQVFHPVEKTSVAAAVAPPHHLLDP